ncbi:MAG: hypothetical protein LDL39_05395 [Magnetospirillum sp.]|nr:hypothetical protein [Magnetospirillum sp.]
MTTATANADNLHSADTQGPENRDFANRVRGLLRRRRNRSVIEGGEDLLISLDSLPENDLVTMAKTLARTTTRTRFSAHSPQTQLDLCAAAALLHDPALAGMALLTINLVEGETLASVRSAINKRITRSNGGLGALYFGVLVEHAKQKTKPGKPPAFSRQPHVHLIVLDCARGSPTFKALLEYCRARGRTKEARSGHIKAIDHNLWNVVGYLQKNLIESQAGGQLMGNQCDDEVTISTPIRELADVIGQGDIDILNAAGLTEMLVNARQGKMPTTPFLGVFERDAPVMVRVVKALEAQDMGRMEAVRRVVEAWAIIRGFKPPLDGAP